jgi:mannosyltransferase
VLSRHRPLPPIWLLAPILASILAFSVLRLLRRQPLPASTLAPDTASQVAQDTAPRTSPLAIPWLAGPALALIGMIWLRVVVGGREAITLGLRPRLRLRLAQCTHVGRWFWPAVVLTLAGFLRLPRMCANSLWFDEAFSWLVARQPGRAILTQRLEPILPPLYYYLLHFWLQLGESEAALRSLSVLCSLLTVPVMYLLGRELLTPATGLAAALLTAILPFQVYFAQEARLYAMVVLLSALMVWGFVRSWKSSSCWPWLGWGVLVALNLYAHYFAVFTLLVFHAFALPIRPRRRYHWRGLLVADVAALALVGPNLRAAWASTRQATSHFWLPTPSPLEPLKTLDYLLFGHTTPLRLVPVALFLTLSIFTLVIWTVVRSRDSARPWLFLLIGLVLGPIFVTLLLSWVVSPIYLDRSFSLVTPAYVLLLGWGLAHPPRRSPLRLLYGGLAILVTISLGNYYLNPDPAKPPFREIGAILREGWQDGDVLFHLHDSSYLPLMYYGPETEGYLLNNDPDAWLPPYTWGWAGRRVSSLDEAAVGKSRLWLVVTPGRLDDRQVRVLHQAEISYKRVGEWAWPSVDPVQLRLYSLDNLDQPYDVR